jgi:hypothetical protein
VCPQKQYEGSLRIDLGSAAMSRKPPIQTPVPNKVLTSKSGTPGASYASFERLDDVGAHRLLAKNVSAVKRGHFLIWFTEALTTIYKHSES